MRPGGAGGGVSSLQGQRQQQFAMGVQPPQQQGFHMMQQQQAHHMFQGQPAGVYPGASGFGQMPVGMQQAYMGQAGMPVQQGMVPRGMAPPQPAMVPGITPGMAVPQSMTPEQQKKFAEQQSKLFQEKKKKEEQERKDRFREEQKRKLKEFSSGGRASLGSKSLDMGDLLSKSLMTSPGQHPGMQYQHGISAMQAPGFMSHNQQHRGMSPMQGGAISTRQPLQPAVGDTPQVTHSQSLDDGFSDFKKAAPPPVSSLPSINSTAEGDDFGDFLQAPSAAEQVPQPAVPPQQPLSQQPLTQQPLPQQPLAQQPPPSEEDDSFGDFLGGPNATLPSGDTQQQPGHDQTQGDAEAVATTPDTWADSTVPANKGTSLESFMMQSTDLSESQKQRKRFNQKPSLNEVKGQATTSPRTASSTFAPSVKARQWQQPQGEDLSSLFTLPGAAQTGGQQQGPSGHGGGQVDMGQVGMGQPAAQNQPQPGALQLPTWLQNESSLPTVYRQVLEASTQDGTIHTNLLYPIFLLSGLDRTFLGHIWSMVNHTMPGQLVAQELYMALALIAQAQRGQEVSIQSLCGLPEAPIPQLHPQAPAQATTAQQPPPTQAQGTSAAPASTAAAPLDEGDDFAPFQEAPKSTPSIIPALPRVLPSLSKSGDMISKGESSSKASKKTSSAPLTSLVIPTTSSSISSRHSSSPAYTQDHTPTEGDDDESFDDFKSAPSGSGPTDSDLDPPTIPSLPGPGLKTLTSVSISQGKPSVGASHIPTLVPPKGKSAGTFAAIPPPPHGANAGGSSAVRAFGSEEQLRTGGLDDFGDFGDFKAADFPSGGVSQKKGEVFGSFAGHQFKHSASESNLQGMHKSSVDDRYAALRDIGGSLFDPVTLDMPVSGTSVKDDDNEYADFQQAGAVPSIAPLAPQGESTIPSSQGLFDPLSTGSQLQQPNHSFAAFSPPKEGSDWAEAAKLGKVPRASSPQEEEFEGFFSSRTNEAAGIKNNSRPPSDSFDKYSSLSGLHSFVTDKNDDEVEKTLFGEFQTSTAKPHTSSTSLSVSEPAKKVSTAPSSSGVTLFRLTPPPMTSSSPSSEDAPGEDRFSVLRDLSAVDPFEEVGSPPGIDGTGADYYDTQFDTMDPAVKAPPKPGLDLDVFTSGNTSKANRLELTLDTPSTATSKTFPIGSISELDLKNYDLNLSVDSSIVNSKGGPDDSRDRGDSFGDFASATSVPEEPAPAKANCLAVVPSSGHPLPVDKTLFGDRYSQVAGDSSDEGRHASEWEKCLTKCHEVMSKANSVFNNISSSSVCSEVIGSSAGVDYLTGVTEVYRVACRITTSIQGLGIDNDVLGKLQKDINKIWHNLLAFLELSSIKPQDGSFVFKTAMLRPEPSNTPQACGVCLLNVDSRSKAFDRSEDSHKLSYGGRQYHATCANLWVNMVDSILPALPLNTLL